MFPPHPGLFDGVSPDVRARMVSDLSGYFADLSSALEDACDTTRDLEKGLDRILFGEKRDNPFERVGSSTFPR